MKKAGEFLDEPDAAGFLDAPDDAPEAQEPPEAPEPKPARREFEDMLDEFGQALDEIANALNDGKKSSRDIGDTLAQLLDVIRAREGDNPLAAMTKAIKGLRAVTVQVNPTPINMAAPVVQVIERATPAEYDISFDYDDDDRIKGARLVPVGGKAPKAEPAGPRVIWPGDHKTAE